MASLRWGWATSLWVVSLGIAAGCGVDRTGLLDFDGSVGCVSVAACDDGYACTVDTCDEGVCTNTPNDAACADMPGGVCDPSSGCRYEDCVEEGEDGCRVNGTNEALCQVGACVDGECTGVTTCTEGQLCCGDGECIDCPDDGNECTEEVCGGVTGAHTCEHRPLSGTLCSDGLGCTTGDICTDGVCTVTECAPPTMCSDDGERCVGCNGDGDCPADDVRVFDCEFAGATGDGRCGGMRRREVTRFSCNGDRECVADTETTMEPCNEARGVVCGDSTTRTGTCGYSDECDLSAMRTDTRQDPECNGSGRCVVNEVPLPRMCNRDTNGIGCGPMISYGMYGACMAAAMCAATGTQSRPQFQHRCAAGSCAMMADGTDSRSCDRDVAGNTCAPTETGDWSACGGFRDECGEDGMRTRTVTTYECDDAGGCIPNVVMETEACTRNTDGDSCGVGMETGEWGACQYSNSMDCVGGRSRRVSTYTCSGGTCNETSGMMMDTSGFCATERNGHMCGGVRMECTQNMPTSCSSAGTTQIITPLCASGVCTDDIVAGTPCTYDPTGEPCMSGDCSGGGCRCDSEGSCGD